MENGLVVFNETKLRSIIAEAIAEVVSSNSVANEGYKTDEYLSYTEAVAFLKVSKPTFAKIRSKFPCYRPSENRVLFKKADLVVYLESCKVSN